MWLISSTFNQHEVITVLTVTSVWWGFRSSAMWPCVAGLVFCDISKTIVPSTSRVERAKMCGGKGGQTGIPLLTLLVVPEKQTARWNYASPQKKLQQCNLSVQSGKQRANSCQVHYRKSVLSEMHYSGGCLYIDLLVQFLKAMREW